MFKILDSKIIIKRKKIYFVYARTRFYLKLLNLSLLL